MPLYRSRLFEMSPTWGEPPPRPPFNARGWKADYRFMEAVLDADFAPIERIQRAGHQTVVIDQEILPDESRRIVYAPEIVIEAATRQAAQRASNLITAAKTLLDGDFTTGDPYTAIPDDSSALEDLFPPEYDDAIRVSVCTGSIGLAAEVAAKTTHRRRWKLGLVKYWLSLRTCSVPTVDLHPRYSYKFTVDADPINHAVMAQAIIAGYSAIEELDLQIKASANRPSRLPDGSWNPLVLADLHQRLSAAGIDIDRTIGWHLRNTPTRIERRHAPPSGARAPWAARYGVRDRMVRIDDAIGYASLLRSRVSAHASHTLTKSLTVNDVHNVQHLARRLLLETLGYWDRLVPKRQ